MEKWFGHLKSLFVLWSILDKIRFFCFLGIRKVAFHHDKLMPMYIRNIRSYICLSWMYIRCGHMNDLELFSWNILSIDRALPRKSRINWALKKVTKTKNTENHKINSVFFVFLDKVMSGWLNHRRNLISLKINVLLVKSWGDSR